MFNKKKIMKYEQRIAELEDILCPFNQHDWIEVDWHLDVDCDVIHHYKCKRCRKYVETIRSL